EAAPPLGRALETARGDEREIIVNGLTRLGAPGAAEALRIYPDGSQAAEARADAARVLGAVGGEANVAALIAGAGAKEPIGQLATQQSLSKAAAADEKVSAAIAEKLEADSTCGAEVGILARIAKSGEAVDHAWQRCAKSGDFALRLRLARALRNPS